MRRNVGLKVKNPNHTLTPTLARCARTEKYLHALLLGQWVVSHASMLKVQPYCYSPLTLRRA